MSETSEDITHAFQALAQSYARAGIPREAPRAERDGQWWGAQFAQGRLRPAKSRYRRKEGVSRDAKQPGLSFAAAMLAAFALGVVLGGLVFWLVQRAV